MKRLLFYIPAILGFLGYIAMGATLGFSSVSIWAWIDIVLLGIGGVILDCNKWYGSLAGIIVAAQLIILGMQENGQVLDIEIPVGIAIAIYYVVMAFVAKFNKD